MKKLPAAAPESELRKLLYPASGDPTPLYCAPKNFGLIWSAKAGCTMGLLWFLGHSKLLEAQRQFDKWPHFYRVRVLMKEAGYLQGIKDARLSDTAWVKLIRNPYRRAVSSYMQSLTNGYNDAAVTAFTGREVTKSSGYSFREYLEHLAGRDIMTCNPHEFPQRHAVEDFVRPLRVINMDRTDIWEGLRQFEAEAGLSPMAPEDQELLPSEALRVAGFHHAARAPMAGAADVRFDRSEVIKRWPEYQDFLTSDLKALIEVIYRVDFDAYGAVL